MAQKSFAKNFISQQVKQRIINTEGSQAQKILQVSNSVQQLRYFKEVFSDKLFLSSEINDSLSVKFQSQSSKHKDNNNFKSKEDELSQQSNKQHQPLILTQGQGKKKKHGGHSQPRDHHNNSRMTREKENDDQLSQVITQVPQYGSNVQDAQPSAVPSLALLERQQAMEQGYLPRQRMKDFGKKTLILDLDETLVHSSFKYVPQVDIVLPIEIEGKQCDIYILKRPGVDDFLSKMSQIFEIVIFTASLSKYASPLIDLLDNQNNKPYKLFREHCMFFNNTFIKDLSRLGRDLKDVIIIDNSPSAYMLQPENALPILSWYDDSKDRELNKLVPVLEKLSQVDDVRLYVKQLVKNNKVTCKEKTINQIFKQEQFMKQAQMAAVQQQQQLAHEKMNINNSTPIKLSESNPNLLLQKELIRQNGNATNNNNNNQTSQQQNSTNSSKMRRAITSHKHLPYSNQEIVSQQQQQQQPILQKILTQEKINNFSSITRKEVQVFNQIQQQSQRVQQATPSFGNIFGFQNRVNPEPIKSPSISSYMRKTPRNSSTSQTHSNKKKISIEESQNQGVGGSTGNTSSQQIPILFTRRNAQQNSSNISSTPTPKQRFINQYTTLQQASQQSLAINTTGNNNNINSSQQLLVGVQTGQRFQGIGLYNQYFPQTAKNSKQGNSYMTGNSQGNNVLQEQQFQQQHLIKRNNFLKSQNSEKQLVHYPFSTPQHK